jgi:predicted nucleic acid-binding protein
MTKYWEFTKVEAQEVILNLIQGNPNIQYIGLDYDAIGQAFELEKNLNHDLYDCYYLTGALSSNCHSILTTDTDFEKLCKKIQLTREIRLNMKILSQRIF